MYEILEHTADIGLRMSAPDVSTLFADAGRGLFSVIVSNLDDVRPQVHVEFKVAGTELDYMLVDWLNELLYAFESRRLLFNEFTVSVGPDGLTAIARGEVADERRHQLEHEVKAITYHGLKIGRENDHWTAEVILDI
jgi:SHS2 domain-containing protein